MAKKTYGQLSAQALKDVLWETLMDVRTDKVNSIKSNAICNTSREIMRVIGTEVRIYRMAGRKPSARLLEMK
jgi:hypothetical protein